MISKFLIVFILLEVWINCAKCSKLSFKLFPEFKAENIRFLLWTRGNYNENFNFYILKYNNSDNLQNSPFDGKKKTYIHFHGFTNEGTMKWILTSKTNILSVEDANILSVDYGLLVPGPEINYSEAVKMMYTVAEYVALFVDYLIDETELTTTGLHFIGHSLGAHAAGMTAKDLKSGLVERITGLDPAGPQFELQNSNLRLDKSQAKFVDIIHTNACFYGPLVCRGILKAIGHVDFYPNGGMVQPGCGLLGGIECSHQRVTDLWNESIIPFLPKFTSWPCECLIKCISGSYSSCGEGCLDMGFYLSTSLIGTYSLSTNSASPFAQGDK